MPGSVCILPKASSETRSQVQVVYLEADHSKHYKVVKKWNREGKEAHKFGLLSTFTTVGQLEFSPAGEPRETM